MHEKFPTDVFKYKDACELNFTMISILDEGYTTLTDLKLELRF